MLPVGRKLMYAFINRIRSAFRLEFSTIFKPKPPVCWCGAEDCKIRSHAKSSNESDQARRHRRDAQLRRHAKAIEIVRENIANPTPIGWHRPVGFTDSPTGIPTVDEEAER